MGCRLTAVSICSFFFSVAVDKDGTEVIPRLHSRNEAGSQGKQARPAGGGAERSAAHRESSSQAR